MNFGWRRWSTVAQKSFQQEEKESLQIYGNFHLITIITLVETYSRIVVQKWANGLAQSKSKPAIKAHYTVSNIKVPIGP